jgi:hypothetical protein
MLSVRVCLVCVMRRRSPAMRGSSDLIELNGDDLRRDALNVRKASAVESSRVLVGPNSARVLRRLGLAAPTSRATNNAQTTQGSVPLKGGYHVPFRHNFNRRQYRHGTC